MRRTNLFGLAAMALLVALWPAPLVGAVSAPISAIDGRPVHSFDEMLAYLITNKGPGDTVILTVLRGDEKVDISLTLDKRPK